MNNRDEDLTLENVDERIEQIRRAQDNQIARGRVVRELQSVYEISPTPLERTVHDLERVYAEDQRLERVWERISQRATSLESPYPSTQEEISQLQSFQGEQKTMRDPSANNPGSFQQVPGGSFQPPRPPRRRRGLSLALGLAAAIILVGIFAWTITTLVHGKGTQTASGTPTATIATATPTPSPTAVPFKVTSVDMAVSPTSLSGYACGTSITVTYTATFHFPGGNAGGTVAFDYTTNNGRSQTAAQLSVQPGQTSVPYKFTWSGALPTDHTMPEPGGVMVVSPNALTSALLGPTGSCSSPSAAFSVTSVGVTASPALTGHACGTAFTETYTATFHIAANGPGGTLVFTYTTTNGRGTSQNIDLQVAAGQTTATYTFTWSGTLEPGSPDPGNGIVLVAAPNQVLSSDGVPSGHCS
jgi:hypothetical protein